MISAKSDVKNNNNDVIKMFVISFLTSLFVVFCFTPYFARNAIIKTARNNHRKQINVVNINGIPICNPVKDYEGCAMNEYRNLQQIKEQKNKIFQN